MDRISGLPDDLLLNILSMVPSKDAVTTSLLSKRWCDLWKLVPKLWYIDPYVDSEYWRASRFVEKFLLLHDKAPILETLHLSLSRHCPPTDIETWIRIAISRGVRNIQFFQHRPYFTTSGLPRSLYTCESLVTLRLQQAIIVDVPLTICLRSLKLLVLTAVGFSCVEIVHSILSGCPVLEALEMVLCIFGIFGSAKTLTIAVPSLRSFLVVDSQSGSQVPRVVDGIVIKAPSLKSLTIVNRLNWIYSFVNMPKLVKANIKLPHGDYKTLLGCLTSAKHLSLCIQTLMDPYRIGIFFQLVSLTLCTCSFDWFRLILIHTPKLRVLRFELQVKLLPDLLNHLQGCYICYEDVQPQWGRPISVPQCLISSLETVEWIEYRGTEAEKKMVMYLLENSGQLKTMAIRPLKEMVLEQRHKMLQELSSMPRISSKCRLSFT